MSDEAIVERLTEVRGVGRWTVEMILMVRLGRLDVWPVDDFGVRKGYSALYGLNELVTPKALVALGEKYRPYRSVAAWYCWRALEP
jgi:DNA-3-methyladenine glycosylase II